MAASEAASVAAEAAVEEVASTLEEAAQTVRKAHALTPTKLGYLGAGLVIGVAVGVVIGRRWMKEKVKAEAFAQSEKELDQIREYYANTRPEKPTLEEVMEEKGYTVPPDQEDIPERPLPPPVPVDPERTLKVDRPEPESPKIGRRTPRTEEAEKDKMDGWSYPFELSQRNWQSPHIIHQDEFAGGETEYAQTTYTYYAGDDVLVDTDGTVLHNRENLIGREALNKFGHGTDDFNIVYVRNPPLELEIEIIREPGKYEVEVLGFEEPNATDA